VPRSLWGIVTSLLWEDLVREAMPNHLSAEQIARYRGRGTPPEELLQVDDHISQCAECRERLASPSDIRSALQRADHRRRLGFASDMRSVRGEIAPLGEHRADLSPDPRSTALQPEHIAYEQLEAFVDGTASLAECQVVRAHLEFCSTCADELRDLNTFKAELIASKGQHDRGAAGWWAAFAAPWFTPSRAALALAMSALIVLVVALERKRLASPPSDPFAKTAKTNPTGPATTAGQSLVPSSISLAIAALPPDEQRGVIEAISKGTIKPPDILAELHGRPEPLRGESPESARFEVLEPLAEVVSDVRPVFRWQSLAGATSYSVAIFDPALNPVQSSPPLRGTQWKPTRPLKRGQVYQWQATAAMIDGRSINSPAPPSPGAKFRVLDRAKAEEFEQFRKAHPEVHLVLGIVYGQAGLSQDAESELRRIPEGDPDYELAERLLRSLREKR
jgi:anti-sigma factor RsiW